MSARILVIEDDEGITRFLRRGLAYEGYAVDVATNGQAGLMLARDTPPDLVVLDLMLPGIDGLAGSVRPACLACLGEKAIFVGFPVTSKDAR